LLPFFDRHGERALRHHRAQPQGAPVGWDVRRSHPREFDLLARAHPVAAFNRSLTISMRCAMSSSIAASDRGGTYRWNSFVKGTSYPILSSSRTAHASGENGA